MKKAIPYVLVGLAAAGLGYWAGCTMTKKAAKSAPAPAAAATTTDATTTK